MAEEQRQLLAEAEHELRGALTIAASSDFAARVSAAVRHAEPTFSRSAVPVPWWIGLAAAAVVFLALYVGWPDEREPMDAGTRAVPAAAPAPPRDTHAAVVEETPDAVAPPPEPVRLKQASPRGARTATRTAAPPAVEPVVIVPPDQQRAIARLRELLRTGTLDEKTLPAAVSESASLAPVVVPPLVVPEIPVPDVNEPRGLSHPEPTSREVK